MPILTITRSNKCGLRKCTHVFLASFLRFPRKTLIFLDLVMNLE